MFYRGIDPPAEQLAQSLTERGAGRPLAELAAAIFRDRRLERESVMAAVNAVLDGAQAQAAPRSRVPLRLIVFGRAQTPRTSAPRSRWPGKARARAAQGAISCMI